MARMGAARQRQLDEDQWLGPDITIEPRSKEDLGELEMSDGKNKSVSQTPI